MTRLNKLETDVAKVAADLFDKGTPEFRIAEYAHHRKMTRQQLSNLLNKLENNETGLTAITTVAIHTHFRDMEKGMCFDTAKKIGKTLRKLITTDNP